MVSVEYLPWQHGWRMGAGGGSVCVVFRSNKDCLSSRSKVVCREWGFLCSEYPHVDLLL